MGKRNAREWSKLDFGARIYDGRIAKFLSIDPEIAEYPWATPYSFAANMPISHIDYNGENPIRVVRMAWKAIKKWRRANKRRKSFDVKEFLKDEAAEVLDNVLTIIDPDARWWEIINATADLTLDVDFRTKKGRRVKKLISK